VGHAAAEREQVHLAEGLHHLGGRHACVEIGPYGWLDTVVNNAGVKLLGPTLDTPAAQWDQMVAVNTQGLLYVTHAALRHLVRAGEDSPRRVADLVNIAEQTW
jgi:NADP-dependent 3-hydroxy acid dehydrogenase YdfG